MKLQFNHPKAIALILILIITVSTLSVLLYARGTTYLTSGFETGDFTDFDYSTGATVQSSVKNSGTYAALFDSSGDVCTFDTAITTSYTRAYFYITALPDDGSFIRLLSLADTSDRFAWLDFIRSGSTYSIEMYSALPTDDWDSYAFTLETNTWYSIELKYVQHASTGEYRFYLDGVERGSRTSVDTSGGSLATIQFGRVYDEQTTATNLYMDDVVVADSYIGPINADPTPTPSPTPTATPTPTPTPTPAPHSDYFNTLWIEHIDTDYLNYDAATRQAIVNNMVAGNIQRVFVQAGNYYTSDGTSVSIQAWHSASQYTDLINSIHTYSGGTISVDAWCLFIPGYTSINLGSSTARTNTVNAALNFVNTYGFDGWNDDLIEQYAWDSTYFTNYITYANQLGTAFQSAGKGISVDLFCNYVNDIPSLYGGITNVDYVCPMLYAGADGPYWDETDVTTQLTAILADTSCPVLAGLLQYGPYTLSQQLGWIGNPADADFTGVSLFSLAEVTSSDWTALATWSESTAPTPTPTPTPVYYYLTVAAGANGDVIANGISGNNTIPYVYTEPFGASISVLAIPDSGYSFSYWSLDGTSNETRNPWTQYLNANLTLTAYFTAYVAPTATPTPTPAPYPTPVGTNNLTLATTTGGTTNPPPGAYTYTYGDWYPFYAVPNSGYVFSYWSIYWETTTENVTYTSTETMNPYYKSLLYIGNLTVTAYFIEESAAPTPTSNPSSTPPTGERAETLSVSAFWQYLYAGNALGFFQAIFLWQFLILDILAGAILSLFLIPIYLRTKSLLLNCVIWILIGGSMITVMPSLGLLAILFLVLGIGGVLWRLVHP